MLDTPVGPLLAELAEEHLAAYRRLREHVKSLPARRGDGARRPARRRARRPSRTRLPGVLRLAGAAAIWPPRASALAAHSRTHPLLNRLRARAPGGRDRRLDGRPARAHAAPARPAFAYPGGGVLGRRCAGRGRGRRGRRVHDRGRAATTPDDADWLAPAADQRRAAHGRLGVLRARIALARRPHGRLPAGPADGTMHARGQSAAARRLRHLALPEAQRDLRPHRAPGGARPRRAGRRPPAAAQARAA